MKGNTVKIDDWVLIPELDQENPLHHRRNQISTPNAGKYFLAVRIKGESEACLSELTLSKSTSRNFFTNRGYAFAHHVCKRNPKWYLCGVISSSSYWKKKRRW